MRKKKVEMMVMMKTMNPVFVMVKMKMSYGLDVLPAGDGITPAVWDYLKKKYKN